jgi:hypothetical protein
MMNETVAQLIKNSVDTTYTLVHTDAYDYPARDKIDRLTTIVGIIADNMPAEAKQAITDLLEKIKTEERARLEKLWPQNKRAPFTSAVFASPAP